MKFAQKLVLVPQEEWEKIKPQDIQVKQVTVNVPLQKVVKSRKWIREDSNEEKNNRGAVEELDKLLTPEQEW